MRSLRTPFAFASSLVAIAACTALGTSPVDEGKPLDLEAARGFAAIDLGQYTCRVDVTSDQAGVTVSSLGSVYDSYAAPDDVYLVDCFVEAKCRQTWTLDQNNCESTGNEALSAACAQHNGTFDASARPSRVLKLRRSNPNVQQPINATIAAQACSVFGGATSDDVCKGLMTTAQGTHGLDPVFSALSPNFTVVHGVQPGTYGPSTYYCSNVGAEVSAN